MGLIKMEINTNYQQRARKITRTKLPRPTSVRYAASVSVASSFKILMIMSTTASRIDISRRVLSPSQDTLTHSINDNFNDKNVTHLNRTVAKATF